MFKNSCKSANPAAKNPAFAGAINIESYPYSLPPDLKGKKYKFLVF